ncbi:MAG: EthD family reductase [Caldilineaceae bacterium]|nr:EthD family reductase [Caldilineaceae bacterium]
MMAKVVVFYPPPADVDGFLASWRREHAPWLVSHIPGVTRTVYSKALWTFDGEPPCFLLAEFYFPSLEALQKGFPPATAQELAAHAAATLQGCAPIVFVCMEEAAGEIGARQCPVHDDRKEIQPCIA